MTKTRTAKVWSSGALLAAILIHNLTYPLASAEGVWPALFYALYASIFVLGAFTLEQNRFLRAAALASGVAVFAAGLANSYGPRSEAELAVFLTSIIYHAVMIVVLARYIFGAQTVMTDVLLSATSLYLVIGSLFAAIFALIEWTAPSSFLAASGAEMGWQQLIYYSYVTLTTVGYGDITPQSHYAQAAAAFEAVIGVLYTVVLLSRLVAMYGQENRVS
jgi:voltage-gated potassium channel